MTESEFTYWACLSFSQLDNCPQRPGDPEAGWPCWGDWLLEKLRTFPVPAEFAGQINARGEIIPKRIDPVFQADDESSGNSPLSEPIRQALDQSRCLVVICSPRSAKSLRMNEAVRYFKQRGRGNRILPLIIAGEPNASDGTRPGTSPEDECFVPALRHPVNPDGTLDTTRRDRSPIFADARHGADKREVRAEELDSAETALETAKIQLIAGLLGVGFNGLWGREQRRRFAEAQVQARSAWSQVRELQQQVQAARDQAQRALEKVSEAQTQARVAQDQVQAALNQAQEAQARLLEAQNQAREAQRQLQVVKLNAQESQNRVPEAQPQSPEVEDQIAVARNQAQALQSKVLEAQDQVRDALRQVQEARSQAQGAEAKVQETEAQAREAQNQLEEARNQAHEAQNKALESQQQAREARTQTEAARNQTQEAQKGLLEARNQAREAEDQAREAHEKVLAAQDQARAALNKVQEIASQTQAARTQLEAAGGRVRAAEERTLEAQNQIREVQNKTRAARRLTKVLALIAVLALLAAGIAWRQRKLAEENWAKAAATGESKLASGSMSQEQLRQTLQKLGGAEQAAARMRNLDELAARIPAAEIPDALKSSTLLLDDRQRCRFQRALLLRLGAADPAAAMADASTVEGKIVNDDGVSDTRGYFQLAVLDRWMQTDMSGALGWVRQLPDLETRGRALERIIPALATNNPPSALALLNDLKPAPGEKGYQLLFQNWADADPLRALEQWQLIPDPAIAGRVLGAVVARWAEQHPEAAWKWVQAQPDAECKAQATEACLLGMARADAPKALAMTESLPDGTWRNNLVVRLFTDWAAKDLEAATKACRELPEGEAKEQAWGRVLGKRIETQPASAAQEITNLPVGDYRQKAVKELCEHWSGTDTPAALAWAEALPTGTERIDALDHIIAWWARTNPPAAMQFANQHPDVSDAALGAIAAAWSQCDLGAATNWVENLPDGAKKDAVLQALANSTAARTPTLAAHFCNLFTTVQPQPELVKGIARALVAEDLSAAVEWGCSLREDATRRTALSVVSEPWARTDPEGLATYARGLPAGAAQTEYLSAACRELAGRDFPATMDLVGQLADVDVRRSLLEQAASSCDLPHLDQAAKFIAAMPAGDDQKAAIKGLLSNWTSAEPEAAANWLRSFPESSPQTEPLQAVIRAWAQSEPAAVAKWLTKAPPLAANEAMVTSFLAGAVEKYPEFAGQWAQSVTNEVSRQAYEQQVARLWMKTSPAAARDWINHLDLPEDIKRPLQAQLP